jgi:hypothetical protein
LSLVPVPVPIPPHTKPDLAASTYTHGYPYCPHCALSSGHQYRSKRLLRRGQNHASPRFKHFVPQISPPKDRYTNSESPPTAPSLDLQPKIALEFCLHIQLQEPSRCEISSKDVKNIRHRGMEMAAVLQHLCNRNVTETTRIVFLPQFNDTFKRVIGASDGGIQKRETRYHPKI